MNQNNLPKGEPASIDDGEYEAWLVRRWPDEEDRRHESHVHGWKMRLAWDAAIQNARVPKVGELVLPKGEEGQEAAQKEREFCEWMIGFNDNPEFVQKFTTLFIDACNERVAKGGYPLHVPTPEPADGQDGEVVLEKLPVFVEEPRYVEAFAAIDENRKPWSAKNLHRNRAYVFTVERWALELQVELLAALREIKRLQSKEESPEQAWIDCPDAQGWWWHFYDGAAVPFPYGVLWSGTASRFFVQYPDSRWCDEVGGKWMLITVPAAPYTPPEGTK